MTTNKVTLEDPMPFPRMGMGYEPPAGGGPLPPGWFAAPHEEQPWMVPEAEPPGPTPDRMTAREFLATRQPPPPVGDALAEMAKVVEAAVTKLQPQTPAGLPEQRVNLDNGTARFMGYDVQLTTDGLESIKIILAAEVCLRLEIERERVLAAVQQQRVPPAGGGGRPDVPEMPEPPQSVDSATAGTPGEVLGMWSSITVTPTEDVLYVSSAEASTAREGSGTRSALPGEDVGSLPQPGELLQRDGEEPAHVAEDRPAPKRRSNKPKPRVRRGKRAAVGDVS